MAALAAAAAAAAAEAENSNDESSPNGSALKITQKKSPAAVPSAPKATAAPPSKKGLVEYTFDFQFFFFSIFLEREKRLNPLKFFLMNLNHSQVLANY